MDGVSSVFFSDLDDFYSQEFINDHFQFQVTVVFYPVFRWFDR